MIEILNLSGMYDHYDLSAFKEAKIICLKGTPGTKLYVDPEGERLIRDLMSHTKENRIHLIDIGDYHYITRLYLYDMKEPFDLLVLDNHSDDQEPVMSGLKSCGSWIRDAIDDIPDFLMSVKLIKAEDDISMLKGSFDPDRPLYISIDKDVLSPDECPTNWDQGNMTVGKALDIIKNEMTGRRIAGMDLSGGPAPEETPGRIQDIKKNEEIDRFFIEQLRIS